MNIIIILPVGTLKGQRHKIFTIFFFPESNGLRILSLSVLNSFANTSEPKPVEPTIFETWSRSRNYLFNKYRYRYVRTGTAVSFEDARMKKNSH